MLTGLSCYFLVSKNTSRSIDKDGGPERTANVLVWHKQKKNGKQFLKRCSSFSSFWHAKRFGCHRLSCSRCSLRLTFFHVDIPPTSASFSSPVTKEKQDVWRCFFLHRQTRVTPLSGCCCFRATEYVEGSRHWCHFASSGWHSLPTAGFTQWILKCNAMLERLLFKEGCGKSRKLYHVVSCLWLYRWRHAKQSTELSAEDVEITDVLTQRWTQRMEHFEEKR